MGESSGSVVEPALFPHAACAVTFSALIDNQEATIVFVVEAREPVTGRLTGLWSSSPVGCEKYDTTMREAAAAFREMVWDNTGPFA